MADYEKMDKIKINREAEETENMNTLFIVTSTTIIRYIENSDVISRDVGLFTISFGTDHCVTVASWWTYTCSLRARNNNCVFVS